MKNLFISILVLSCISDTYAQIGIKANGSAPITSAQLEVQSTTKAFYPPRMTTAQKNAIVGVAAGAVVYDTDLAGLFTFNGSSWVSGVGLTLPYSITQDLFGRLLSVTNSNSNVFSPGGGAIHGYSYSGIGIHGDLNGFFGIGVKGESSSFSGIGGFFSSPSGKALETSGRVRIAGSGVGTLGANKFLKSINSSGDAEWSDLLPITNSQSSTLPIIDITNTNTGSYDAVIFKTNTTGSNSAVVGKATNTSAGSNSRGVTGENSSTNSLGSGVYGFHAGTGSGVGGYSFGGKGVKGTTYTGNGVYGESLSGSTGVYGTSTSGNGVEGFTNSNGTGIRGSAINGGIGVAGNSDTGIGVLGLSNYVGGYFSSNNSSGYALVTDFGKVGFGTISPNLNTDERVDINGRLRIRHSLSSAGVWFNNSANSLSYADGAFWGMKLDTESGVYVGNAWRFWVNNLGNATLTGTLTQLSDRRLKKDFSSLSNSLSDVYQLNGYHYKWIEASRSQDLQTGLIAQEVQKIFPELVQTDEKGFLSVNYIGLIPHLIEAVKELRNENKDLKNTNQKLENRLEKIETMLTISNILSGK